LKQLHRTRTKRKAIAIKRRSCSDSLLTAIQVDEVFGSDSRVMTARSTYLVLVPGLVCTEDPHPKMPDMNLSRSETAEIVAHIGSFNR
jgi:hypothetical protein